MKMYLKTKNEISRLKLSKVRAHEQGRQTDTHTQTGATENIIAPYSRVVKSLLVSYNL